MLAGAFVSHSQGTVSFANYLALPSYIYVSLVPGNVRLGGESTGDSVAGELLSGPQYGNLWTVGLYGAAGWGDPASSLVELSTATFADGGDDSVPGTWFSDAICQVPGTTVANHDATVQLYAWCNDGGNLTSYAAALAAGVPAGFSATANVTAGGLLPGGTILPPAALPSGLNFTVTSTTIPEPSTVVLGVMGAAVFLLRFPRKLRFTKSATCASHN